MNIQRDQSQPYKLGDWLVKPSVDRIERDGVSKTLEPRAMDILVYLSQRPRAVVSIEHLITGVWAGQIVSDNTVYQWIRILRKALDDDPAKPAYIETITKRGYRLIARVEPLQTGALRKHPRRIMAWASVAIMLLAGLVYYSQRPAPGGGGAALAPSIAVLPFVNHTGDEPGLRFADGIHDEVLTTLAKLEHLRVISRTSVMNYRDAGKDLPTIGEELGVSTVLEGGVQHINGRVRINVQLIDARTDEHLWAETFDRELTAANIFAIQTDIANAVADSFEIDLSPAVQQRLASLPTEDTSAWESYLWGKQLMARSTITSITDSIDHFLEATRKDPEFALAFAALADAYTLLYWHEEIEDTSLPYKARAAAEDALALNNQLGSAYATLGYLSEGEEAEAAFQKAVALTPNSADAHHWFAQWLREAVRFEESLAQFEKARALDPLSPIINLGLGMAYERLGRFEEAQAQYHKTIEIDPQFRETHIHLAGLEATVNGRIDSSLEILHREAELLSQVHDSRPYYVDLILGNIVICRLQLGDYEGAETLISAMEQLSPDSISTKYARVKLNIIRDKWPINADYPEALQALEAVLDQPILGDIVAVQWLYRMYDLRAGRHGRALVRYSKNFPELVSTTPPEVTPRNLLAAIDLVPVLRATGNGDQAERLLSESLRIIEALPRQGTLGYGIADAMIFALQGENDQALDALEQAIVEHHWRDGALFYLEFEPNLFPLHGQPRYQQLVSLVEDDMAAQLAHVRELERQGNLPALPDLTLLTNL